MAHFENSRRRAHLSERRRAAKTATMAILASLLTATLIFPLVPAQQADAAEPLVFALIEIAKDADPAAATRAVLPGENVQFDIEVSCSSTQTDCVGMKMQDAMPAPLELVTVSNSLDYTQVVTGNAFELTFRQPLDIGGIGLKSGELISVTVTARVPLNANASFDGQTITNTAFITVDNPDSNVQDDAQVLLDIPLALSSTITKTVTPSAVVGFVGTPVNFNLSGSNSSNSVVDTLTIQDPANPASNAFDYLAVTGITNVVFPSGANRVQVDWYDGTTWTDGTPAASASLPGGVSPSLIKGLRLTFSNSNPATDIAVGAVGSFRIATQTTSDVSTLVTDVTGNNLASSQVRFGNDSNTRVTANADFVIRRTAIAPEATKDFNPNAIVGGEEITVVVGGANGGDFSLSRMTITEPKTGSTSLADQGISFDRWVVGASGIEWPSGATAAEIAYLYENGGFGSPLNAPITDQLPAPDTDKGKVLGFRVTFTGVMLQDAYARLPYVADTEPVSASDANLTTRDTISVEVETVGGVTATADAFDDLTRRSSRIDVTTRKIISPSTIYGVSGASALLSLPTDIAPLPPATPNSTIGSKILTVSDNDPEFWDRFNATSIIATDVPATSTMTVRYWNGSAWVGFPTPIVIVGSSSATVPIPAGLRESVAGLQFEFVPTDPAATLPPGFSVQPNIRVALRDTLRGTATPVIDPLATDPIVVNNTVEAVVENPAATPPTANDSDVDSVTVIPVDGEGPNMIDKNWDDEQVRARSGDLARLAISWGTGGLSYDSVVVSDTATDPASGGWNVADTVFEAFDLYQIPAITSGMDPQLRYDAIQSVQLYIQGSGWVPTATNPCGGTACYGAFPGYTLTATERANAVGVRFVFVERPNRSAPTSSNPSAPAIGTGVAPSVGLDRDIDLVFQVRDTRRSAPTVAVLGNSRGALYNLPDAGRVDNTARVIGLDADNNIIQNDTASDDILIVDRPISVSAEKNWFVVSDPSGPTSDSVGVPQVDTDPQYYPEARMVVTGTNISVVRVNELSLAEPTGGTNPFEFFDVSDIVSITVPSGATSSTVTLTRDGAAATNHTIAQALALSSSNLSNVVGMSVVHTGRINTNASTTVTLDTKLRKLERSTGDPVEPISLTDPLVVDNTVTATVKDPAGTSNPVTGTDNVVNATASDPINVEAQNFGVRATKAIEADTTATNVSPAIQYDESDTTAKITLTGQPSGNVRSTQMVLEDFSPSFWNAYNFSAFGPADTGPVSPIQRVQVDALVDGLPGNDLEYLVDGSNTITTECGGNTVLDDCWVSGTRSATLQLPAGVAAADVRGLRFTYTRTDFSNWERPFNPIQTVVFTVDRRDTLVVASPTAPTNDVPSTLFNYDAPANNTVDRAPGEATRGTFTNEVDVTAIGGPVGEPAKQWFAQDDDLKQILFQHLPARVEIKKTPLGLQYLATDIPYKIAVTNRGGVNERDLGDLVVTDVVPTDASGAQLVIPNDPDTGTPYPVAEAFSYELRNAANALQAAPTVTAVAGPVLNPGGQTYTFTLTSPSTLPKGWTLTINATMQLRERFETGINVVNTATVTSDQRFDTCDSFTNVAVQKPQENNVLACVSDTWVQAIASAPMTVVKGVRGVGAGPLDTTDPDNYVALIDPATLLPFDDLGVLKTVPSSSVNCSAPNVATGVVNEYYRFPCVPITRPGGIEEWAATFTNGGNIDVSRIAAIDVLPRGNDRGVIVNEARSSKWTPLLTTMPTLVGGPADAILSVEYITDTAQVATRCNATDIQVLLGMNATVEPRVSNAACLSGPAVDSVPARNWLPLTQGIIDSNGANIVALRLIIDSVSGLIPGQKISVIYRSKTAAAPQIAESAAGVNRDSIAYNSIATAALGDDNGTPKPNRFVIEPRKVGVGMATGGVELAKLVDGANSGAAYLESNYNISLTCTSNGEPFQLRTSAGVLRSPFSIARGAAATLIQGLPLYAKCDVSEANYGSVQTITPSKVIAQAGREAPVSADGFEIYDPNPTFGLGGPRPPIERSTVTNTYERAGFTVTKSIDNGGAVNAAGVPIQYNNFTFTAVCTFFDGVTTNTVLDTSFTLTATPTIPSPTRSFTDLPAGALCTVTETNNRAAASTTVTSSGGTNTTLTNASVSPTVNARVVTTLTANGGVAKDVIVNTMGFTNTYTVGQLTVNKVINGLGGTLYGGGTFTISVSCTRNIAGSSVNVYTNSFTFDRDDVLTRTISNLPTGASCAVTEPAGPGRAGATSTGVSPGGNATIGNATTVSRTVTNTFDLASLAVTKNVITDARDETSDLVLLDSPFTVRVACTFQGAPAYATGFSSTVPMVLSLTATAPGNTQTLTGLPANASCVVTEDQATYTASTDILFYRGSPLTLVSTDTNVLVSRALSLNADVSGNARNAVSVNNNYGVGSFTVTKDILGAGVDQFVAGAPYGDAEFEVQITCTAPNGTSAYDDVVTLTRAVPTVTITTIAADSDCSAVETNAAATGANETVYRDGDDVVISEGDTINVSDPVVPSVITIENWYLTGEVDVTKTVGGAAASTFGSGPFEVTLTCTLDATQDSVNNPLPVVVLNPVREILDGETETFTRLPDGAECVITETDTGSATSSFIVRDGSVVREDTDTGYTFAIDQIDDSILSGADQAQNGFDVQNDFEFAQLAITKDVVSDARINNVSSDPVYYGTFAVSVQCTFNGRDVFADGYDVTNPMENLTLEDADVWTLTQLPFGAECTIEEINSRGAVDPSITTVSGSSTAVTTSGLQAVMTLDENNTATVTNPFDVGSLELSKALIGAGVAAWGNEKFIVDVVCTLTDATSPITPRETWNNSYEFQRNTLTGDVLPASVVLENIATGSDCSITESGTGAANATQITVDTAPAVVATATNVTVSNNVDPQQVVVTNSFDLAEIDVNKVIIGPGAALYGQGPFEITITCTRDINGTTVTIPDSAIPGGPTRWLRDDSLPVAYVANYSGLPQGAECEIVETQFGGADEAGTVIEAGVGAEGPFILGATASDVTVTNFFGDPIINVRKLFAGSPAAQALYGAGPFQVRLDCTRVVNGNTIRVPIPYAASTTNTADDPFRTLDAGNGYIASYEFLPTFALCTMTETQTGGAITSVVSPDPDDYTLLANGVFQLGADQTVGTVDVTNTFEFANFSVTKRVIGTNAGANQDKEFVVELACELTVNGTRQTIAIVDQAERTIRNGETVTWTDLPAGAECTVTETDNGGANLVSLSYRGFPVIGSTVTLASGDSEAILSNSFLLALTGSEPLPWILIGGQLLLAGGVLMFFAGRKRRESETVAQ
ncbi:MAG: DUF5979 domain-containing protein [Microbacteriaceae bacterium]